MRVLVIEDDPAMAAGIDLLLRSEGVSATLATLGSAGIALGRGAEIDLIILDLDLPDMDGYAVLDRLRSEGVRTPVLILSGLAGIDSRVRGLGIGADDFMAKPFDGRELVARIQAIARRSAERKVRVGGLCLSFERGIAEMEGALVELNPEESRLFGLLAKEL